MYGNRADNFRPLITLETSRRFVFTERAFSLDHAACSNYEASRTRCLAILRNPLQRTVFPRK